MATSKRHVDRRIQRTRQVLQQAFKEVVHEKSGEAASIRDIERGFLATSIQDITERANVNRGTFYLHFADKYMLANAVAREQFQLLLASRLPPEPHWDRVTLHLLIQTVLECLEGKYHHQQPRSCILAPRLEQTMHEELTEVLLSWLKHDKGAGMRRRVLPETIARVVSWAIFGQALQWSQEETTISSEQMAHDILLVILEGVVGLTPEALPE
jgi:AcrR family transcriptional regulator